MVEEGRLPCAVERPHRNAGALRLLRHPRSRHARRVHPFRKPCAPPQFCRDGCGPSQKHASRLRLAGGQRGAGRRSRLKNVQSWPRSTGRLGLSDSERGGSSVDPETHIVTNLMIPTRLPWPLSKWPERRSIGFPSGRGPKAGSRLDTNLCRGVFSKEDYRPRQPT